MNKMKGDTISNDKSVKSLKKSYISPVPCKIPKQEKESNGNENKNQIAGSESNDNLALDKSVEKSSSPNQLVLKSQEKTMTNLRSKSSASSGLTGVNKRVLENQFNTKKKRFMSLKKNIEDKQKSTEKEYSELYILREKILASGGKDPGKIEELLPAMPFSARSKRSESGLEGSGTIEHGQDDADYTAELQMNLRALLQDTCKISSEAVNKRSDVLAGLAELEEEPAKLKEEVGRRLEDYKAESTEFQNRLDSMQQEKIKVINDIEHRFACLLRECQLYRQERQHAKALEDSANPGKTVTELLKELNNEKDKFIKARAKVRDQEALLSNAVLKNDQLQNTINQLETQLKQKESTIEAKNKEITKLQQKSDTISLKLDKLDKQKETVESRIKTLKDQLESKDKEIKTIVDDYERKMKQQNEIINEENLKRQEIEKQLEENKERYMKLEEKCQQLLEIREGKKDVTISDKEHSQYEIQLYSEMVEIKNLLTEKENIIQMYAEREKMIAAANKEDSEADYAKEKLTLDFVKKSKELEDLKNNFAQLQINYKKMKEKYEHLEQKLSDMNKLQTCMKVGSKSAYGLPVMQLQQQVTDLQSNLKEISTQKTELERNNTQLKVKLEHYKIFMHEQDNCIKIRKEIKQLLNGTDKNTEIHDQEMYSPVLSKGFQTLYETLESKELQVMKLEKLVKQMEKQDEYSQAQRTRLENRIAKLEFSIKESQQAHRNRGFSFL